MLSSSISQNHPTSSSPSSRARVLKTALWNKVQSLSPSSSLSKRKVVATNDNDDESFHLNKGSGSFEEIDIDDDNDMGNTIVGCDPDQYDEDVKPNILLLTATIKDEEKITLPLQNCSEQSAALASPKTRKRGVSSKSTLTFLKRNLGDVVTKVGGKLGGIVTESLSSLSDDKPYRAAPTPTRKVRGGVLLFGCDTPEKHFMKHDGILERIRELEGEEGLAVAGLEFRWEPCEEHASTCSTTSGEESFQATFSQPKAATESLRLRLQSGDTSTTDVLPDHDDSSVSESEVSSMNSSSMGSPSSSPTQFPPPPPTTMLGQRRRILTRASSSMSCCAHCRTRLYSTDTNELICSETRRKYITDGVFYDEIARLAQEVVFDQLMELGNLEWKLLHDDYDDDELATTSFSQPIRALISKEMQPHLPTLVVVTGKGKVRAGMFSRQHLLMTGMEPASALDTVARAVSTFDDESCMIPMNVVLLDPNCRTDRHAMTTIEKSLEKLLHDEIIPPTSPILIQAHSMAGAQVVRYLLGEEKAGIPTNGILHRLVAIAFSDSTHNIQWTRTQNAPVLGRILDSDKCLYVRSSNKLRDNDWQLHESGQTVATTSHWQHRFGQVPTVWAGTTEHSLSDWYGRFEIWKHFERQLLFWKLEKLRHR